MKKILSILLAINLISASCCVYAADGVYNGDSLSLQSVTGIEWNQNVNTYGVWSIFASSGYWDKEAKAVPDITAEGVVYEDKYLTGSGIVHTEYKYGDLSDSTYCAPVKSTWLDSSYEATTADDIDHNGIRFGLEGEEKSLLLINTNSYDSRVRFLLEEPQKLTSRKGDIIVCFTAPLDGVYNIMHELCDEETDESLLGDGGVVRRSIMAMGESIETPENSVDFIFTKDAPSKESEKVTLSANDRVYIRVSAGKSSLNDNFYAKIIIDRYEDEKSTEPTESYDLSKVGMSTAGNWSFMNSTPENTDYSKYHHMYAYERRNTGKAEAYSCGSNGKRYNVTVPAQVSKAPYVKWSLEGDGRVELKAGAASGTFLMEANPIIVWTAPADGLYSVDLGLDSTSAENGSRVTVSILENGEKEDKNIIKTVTFDGEELTEEELGEIGCSMKKNDKLIIRFATFLQGVPVSDSVYYANPRVRKLKESFEAKYYRVEGEEEIQIFDATGTKAGDIVRIRLNGDNILPHETALLAYTGIYKDGKLLKTFTSDSQNVPKYSNVKSLVECVIPEEEQGLEFRTYVWSDFNKALPLCDEIYFK